MRLRQVVLNLVGNAIKFTAKGEVVVRVELETADPAGVALHFAVSDPGCGIPADKLALIFQPFTQADGSTARRYGGTGLGLTISKRLIELMGGRIWVESDVGKGSTFHFAARFDRAADGDSPARRISGYPLEGTRVLIVDDNATNRRILEAMLRNWAMAPTAVDGGPAALAELERAALAGAPYGLVLVDSVMPVMSGFEVAAHIRERPNLVSVAVMMLTSEDVSGSEARCRELGVASYLIKPIKQGELRRAMQTVLGTAAGIRPRPPAQRPVEPVPADPGTPRTLRILLAEDNPVNQHLALRLLQKQGHDVMVAHNGREAVTMCEEQSFHVVLMDVQMPELDGFEATAAIRLRESRTERHQPIIAMTAHALRGDEERCLAAGMDGYLSKPICSADLKAALAHIVPADPASTTSDPAEGLAAN